MGGAKAFSSYQPDLPPDGVASSLEERGAKKGEVDESSSLLGSEVFANVIERTRLGRGAHLPQRQQQKISRHFQLYAKAVESYKAIARKELLEIYRICRREDWPLRLFVSGSSRGDAPTLAEKRMEYAHTDRSICRFFLSELLRLCGPPFASYFCTAVLRFIAQVIATERSAFRGSEAEGRRLRMAALSFIEQTLRFCDAPSPVPSDVAELAQAVRARLMALPQEEA
ncbi:hypothetical protein cyc_06473 [Cyclospora cayetanensis]|uniref:Uncharacterized protein n=1 Tax=Cyclospora cayetanensis TaxID=88456 RepID=A0A1D3D3I0_9EIME|nr:hypothetical protein cyc_06473 [Cyclospora cayetanensis]